MCHVHRHIGCNIDFYNDVLEHRRLAARVGRQTGRLAAKVGRLGARVGRLAAKVGRQTTRVGRMAPKTQKATKGLL